MPHASFLSEFDTMDNNVAYCMQYPLEKSPIKHFFNPISLLITSITFYSSKHIFSYTIAII